MRGSTKVRRRDSIQGISSELSSHYDSVVEEYVKHFFMDESDNTWLEEFAGYLDPGSYVLDAGCGPGNFSKVLLRNNLRVFGIDISNNMIGAARGLVGGAEFGVMNFAQIRFAANTFDGILAAYSFLHMPKRQATRVLLEFRRVLVPRGVLCLMVKEGLGEGYLASALKKGTHCFTKLWEPSELSRALVRSGFVVISRDSKEHESDKEFPYRKLLIIARSRKRGICKSSRMD